VTYVLSRKPEWILFSTGVKPSAFAERALFTREEFRRWYYPYYFHPSGDINDVRVAYRRSPEPSHPDTVADSRGDNDFINQYYDGMNRIRRWPKEAMDYFQKAMATAPADFAQLYQEIGNLYRGANNTAEAIKYYERAIAADPRLLDSRMVLGYYARDRGDLAVALGHFAALVKYNPDFSMSWTLFGEVQAAMGDAAGAERSFRQALQVARNNEEASRQLLRLQRR
jgi:tetratricopeptide (TPR) repeat protein